MYISKNKHILSNAIMTIAFVNISGEAANTIVRKVLGGQDPFTPELLNDKIWFFQSVISIVQLLIAMVVFIIAYRKINRYTNLIPEEDRAEMARLQEEIIPDSISTLTVRASNQLLQIWAAILIGVEMIYDITSAAYRNFIKQLSAFINIADVETYTSFVAIYNNTHGFKYIGMLIAICLGILTTGVFLRDKRLVFASAVMIGIFLFAFMLMHTSIFAALNQAAGVVWTSVIFHLIETSGLLVLAVYLRYMAKGV